MFDTLGVLILVVLIALFGFLTTRAWRVKNAFLKWGGARTRLALRAVGRFPSHLLRDVVS
jgi:hypothetical protein